MKKIISILLFLVLPINSVVLAQKHLSIHVDKSVSMNESPYQDKVLTNLIMENTKSNSVVLEVQFINDKTTEISNSKTFTYTHLVFDSSKFSKEQKRLQIILHNNKVKRRRKVLAKRIVSFVNSYKAESKQTNIVSSILPLSKVESKEIQAVYFTDGVESSKVFRELDLRPFKSPKQAIESAKVDVQQLQSTYNVPKKLHGVKKVLFILPITMDKKVKGSQFIEEYFTEIYRLLGVSNIKFKTI